ncbi:13922_t:CDS:2 [Funneliformis geosporum]|uniref:18458_t:CDS:1 n=1 Tax=Funneliformis geosporum TaxID=1117311 RepID=A0A9W4SI18_9GLOM|nr:13922_t:CDS:2 [Funneliformis geosporum]CAI2169274.1 18458_t:CDS:2 [Funneliformis geosporum]
MNFNNGLFSSGTADKYFQYGGNNEHSQGQSSSTSTPHQTKPISSRTPRPLGLKRTTSNNNYPVKQDEVSTSIIQNDRFKNHASGMTNMYQTDESPTTLTKTPTYEYYGFVLYLSSFIAFVLISINFLNTAPYDSYHTITDDHANVGQNLSQLSGITDDFVPELHDIPIGIVNACLYQNVDGFYTYDGEA